MSKPSITRRALLALSSTVATGSVVSALTGCGPQSAGSPTAPSAVDPNATVTISVGGLPPTSKQKARDAFLTRVEEFQNRSPQVTVDPSEMTWNPVTFPALLASGSLPTTFNVAFTEPAGMIAKRQVADVTDFLPLAEVTISENPAIRRIVSDAAGRIHAVPLSAYSLGLVYNRDLFAKAGLDPDRPPATWGELREHARAITEKTGVPGFGEWTRDHAGGWMLTSQTYARGGAILGTQGDRTVAAFNAAPTRDALTMLKGMRWEDRSMGSGALTNGTELWQAFAAGKLGMYVDSPLQAYTQIVMVNGAPSQNLGVARMPLDGPDAGALAGGSAAIFSKKASSNELVAAIRWAGDTLRKYTDESLARSRAEAAADAGQPVGIPEVPVVGNAEHSRYLEWTAGSVNIPLENFRHYADSLESTPLIPEPAAKAQEIYAVLDPVIQAVLSRRDADIDQLLGAAETQVNNVVRTV